MARETYPCSARTIERQVYLLRVDEMLRAEEILGGPPDLTVRFTLIGLVSQGSNVLSELQDLITHEIVSRNCAVYGRPFG